MEIQLNSFPKEVNQYFPKYRLFYFWKIRCHGDLYPSSKSSFVEDNEKTLKAIGFQIPYSWKHKGGFLKYDNSLKFDMPAVLLIGHCVLEIIGQQWWQ